VVLHGHFLYSNGNFVLQKEQTKLVDAERAGGFGAGVDSVASSLANTDSFSSGSFEVFIIGVCCWISHWKSPSFLVSVKNGNLMIFSNFFAKKIVVKNFN
tara:strand:- start:340 stop:639 length:300 start_codon:yes stop_codon:yes gene_type:complete